MAKQPTKAQRASFISAAKRLAKLGGAGLYIYLSEDTLCLLNGASHDLDCKPHQERVVERVHIPKAGGGDW